MLRYGHGDGRAQGLLRREGRGDVRRVDGSTRVFEPGAANATVSLLEELAGGGRALEFGIGTGRIALPLASRGVTVYGIDLSQAMVARLRAKPGGDAIDVTIGDIATTRVDGTFSLVYLVFNTIMNLGETGGLRKPA